MTTTATAIITAAQLARCIRMTHEDLVYYEVESETTPNVSYEVRFIVGKGFTCICPAGLDGFHNCSKGTCKHCRWSVEHARRYRAMLARVEELTIAGLTRDEAFEAVSHDVIVDGKPADTETLVRVFSAKGAYPTEGEMNCQADAFENRPFSFMR